MSKHFAGIAPVEAGYEKVRINPQYDMSDSLSCTVPGVKGLITLNYEKTDEEYIINVNLPDDMKAVLYVPDNSVVNIDSETYFRNGEYVKESAGLVEVIVK
jgi:hypothetical protein